MVTDNSRILVTGGHGRIGSLINFGVKPTHEQLDICNKASIEKTFDMFKPSAVLHMAALTDIDYCQQHPDKAYAVNVLGTFNIASICKKRGIKIIYMSSCTVFDGFKKTPYDEADIPNPIHVYGRTKRLGEWIVKDITPSSLIIRTGWLFGNSTDDKGFINLCLSNLKNNKDFIVISTERFGSPTYIPDLIKIISQLISTNTEGLYHVVNKGMTSYFEIGNGLKRIGKFKANIKREKKIQQEFLVRGNMEALISKKIKLRSWQNALVEYLKIT